MEAVPFTGQNTEIAKEQPQYKTLPAFVDQESGTVTCCMKLTPEEIEKVSRTGKIWVSVLTFGNPLQPLFMTVDKKQVLIVPDDDEE